MQTKKYKITCRQCKASRNIKILNIPGHGERIDWLETDKNAFHPINSGRKRLDGKWGFACKCGNDNLLTHQEKSQISNLQSPDPKEIEQIVKDLKPYKTTFDVSLA